MKLVQEILVNPRIRIAVFGLVSLTFLNGLFCTLAYEFGWGPRTYLGGPDDRFADLVKLSLSFRSVTNGMDQQESFQSWKPVYQHYYLHPDFGGAESLAKGELTHFHFPPFSTLMFLLCGLLIVRTGSPELALLLFFCIYLLEAWSIVWVGVPRTKRTPGLTFTIWLFCLTSYPALTTFGRANYVSAGMTTIPIVIFLVAVFARQRTNIASLLALAVAVNVHPNAIIFVLAVPLVIGMRRAIKPVIQFCAISGAMFAISYVASHLLCPDYTMGNFRKALAIYERIYIAGNGGLGGGSSLYGLIKLTALFFRLKLSVPVEMRVVYLIATLLLIAVCFGYWRASAEDRNRRLPLISFFLVGFYCILSPVFSDYHLLVFLAPIIVMSLNGSETETSHSRPAQLVLWASVLLLSPKNYLFEQMSLQVLINPAVLCATLLYVAILLFNEGKSRVSVPVVFREADGQ